MYKHPNNKDHHLKRRVEHLVLIMSNSTGSQDSLCRSRRHSVGRNVGNIRKLLGIRFVTRYKIFVIIELCENVLLPY